MIFIIFAFKVLPASSQAKADFVFDKNEGCGSLAVTFTDQSTSFLSGTVNDWLWDMGGALSVRQNPGIIFTKAGEYTICLTVKTTTGATAKTCKEKIIKVYENPAADFTADVKSGCVPVNASFSDKSVSKNGGIALWIWDVGGSSNLISSTDASIKISTTYSSPGNYSATLSITDKKGCKNTVTKPNLIDVVALTKPKLDYTILSSCDLPWEVRYENLDIDPLIIYTWDFGNGEKHSGAKPPVVKYNESKTFSVKLFMEKGPCKDTVVFQNVINTNKITDFEVEAQGLCTEQNLKLKDISNYYADSLKWDFGDGTTSVEKNPEKTYSKEGCYEIKLTRYAGNCIQESKKPCLNILPNPKIAYNVVNGFSCLIPAKIELTASADLPGVFAWKLTGKSIDTLLRGSSHNYMITAFGEYKADLTFLSEKGCIVIIAPQKIDIRPFETSLPDKGPDGCIPYQAKLNTSLVSSDPIVKWEWKVGNSALFTSSDANPLFQVDQTGRWDLTLVATNSYGCRDTLIRPNYIWGGTPPTIDFTATPLTGCISDKRQFTSTGGTNVDFWSWTYNDNVFFSSEKNPEYAFPDLGSFDISLTASFNGCKKNLRKEQYLTVFKPKSQFKVDYSCDNPTTIGITNQSVGADSLYWVVKLSATATDTIRDSLLSSYTFPGRGIYFLSHYAKNFASGCEHAVSDSIFIVDLKASYTLDTVKGCAPLEVKVSTLIQDAVLTMFEGGQYSIVNPTDPVVKVIFNEPGVILGPKLIVTDRHGCVDSFQANTPVQVSRIAAKIESPDVFCTPDAGVFKDISLKGKAPISYKRWFFTSGNQSSEADSAVFNIPDAGTYFISLLLRDEWGCVDSIKKEIKAFPLIPAFSADTLSCTQKAVRLKVDSDPTFLSKFVWSFGDGTTSEEKNPLHEFKTEGKYNVCAEFFDTRGCSKKACKPNFITIKNPKAEFTGDPVSAPCPPLLSEFKNKSTNASSFTWDFGDNSGVSYNNNPSHVYTIPGEYYVALYAEMIPGCVDTIIKPDFIKLLGPKATMEILITGNCTPLDINLQATSDKQYEYIWDYGDGKIDIIPGLKSSDTTDYTYISPGTFIPKLLVSDDKGCSRTFTLEPVEVNDIKPDFAASSIPLCGLPSELKVENKTQSTSLKVNYQWKAEGIKVYENATANPVFKLEEYGKYNISLIAKAPNCVDSIRRDSIIEVAALPMVDFIFNDTLSCQNVKVGISNNSFATYGKISAWQWTFNNEMTSSSTVPATVIDKSGMYTVKLKATTDKGCKDSIIKNLTILPNTLVSLPQDKKICIGDSIDIKTQVFSTIPFSQRWKQHSTISCNTCSLINVKPSITTTYHIETKALNGCINNDSILITVFNIRGPQLLLSADTTVCKDGLAFIQIFNHNNEYDYQWDKKDVGLDCYSGCKTVFAKPEKSMYYNLVVTNSLGCFKEDSVWINVEKSIADFLLDSKTICENKSTQLLLKSGNNASWRPDPTLSCSNCPSPSAKPDREKYYYVSVTSDAGCRYTDSILVKIQPLSSINAGEDRLVCKGETFTLLGKADGMTEWKSDIRVDDPSSLKTTTKADKTSFYILTSQVDECFLNDTVKINVIVKSKVTAIGDSVCPGEIALLSAAGNSDKYQWIQDGKNMGSGDTLSFQPDKTMTVKVIGVRSICIADTAEALVYVFPKIEYKIDRNEYFVYLNTKDQVEATFDSAQNYKYKWNPTKGLSCADCPEPILKNMTKSTDFSVIVKDQFGCNIKQNIFVSLDDQCNRNGFYIPNIFTPYNRDGLNDDFKVYAEDATEFISIAVYDRWGEKLWSSKIIDENWDGYYLGKELARGVYVYVVTARCDNTNEIINFAGDVTIID